MKSILSALYRSQLNLDEMIVPSHPEYRPLNRKIASMREQWKNQLSEQEYEQMEEMFCLRDKSDGMHMEAAFLQGFKLGSIILIEVMMNQEELLRGY